MKKKFVYKKKKILRINFFFFEYKKKKKFLKKVTDFADLSGDSVELLPGLVHLALGQFHDLLVDFLNSALDFGGALVGFVEGAAFLFHELFHDVDALLIGHRALHLLLLDGDLLGQILLLITKGLCTRSINH